jgi:glycosyltransferase involved in cell wall biosynthesis
MYHTYLKEHEISGLKALILRYALYRMRIWDVVSSNRVDHFIAISTLVQKRIQKYYRRDATVIFPPVDIARFSYKFDKEDYYFTASRLVPYKKVKLIIESFNQNGKHLVVAGTGDQYKELRQIANNNIDMLGFVNDEKLVELMQKAKAFIFTAYEDFGILPVEAMACGTPVIAYGKGGIQDTVIPYKTGIFFNEQTIESLNDALDEFEKISFDHKAISEHAKQFDITVFESKFKDFVDDAVNNKA